MVYLLACFALRICKFQPKANLSLMGGLVSIWLWKKNIFPPFNPQLWLGKALFKSDSRRSLWTAVTQSRLYQLRNSGDCLSETRQWFLLTWEWCLLEVNSIQKYVMHNVRRGSFGLIITHKTRIRRLFANRQEIKWDSMWKAPERVPVEIASSPSVGQPCLYRWLLN